MIVLDPGRLAALAHGDLDALASARQCVVAIGAGRVSGAPAAALLLSDFAAANDASTLVIDSSAAWAGAVWRAGSDALRLVACGGEAGPAEAGCHGELTAVDAHRRGLVDELFHGDWREWLDRWLAHRSTAALDSAALLTGHRGGDTLERAEFARLFAIGHPQDGMEAFLSKRLPQFGRQK